MDDYRAAIVKVLDSHSLPGEDLERAILTGAPEVIDAEEALGIAAWLWSEAATAWNRPHERGRFANLAIAIREAIA